MATERSPKKPKNDNDNAVVGDAGAEIPGPARGKEETSGEAMDFEPSNPDLKQADVGLTETEKGLETTDADMDDAEDVSEEGMEGVETTKEGASISRTVGETDKKATRTDKDEKLPSEAKRTSADESNETIEHVAEALEEGKVANKESLKAIKSNDSAAVVVSKELQEEMEVPEEKIERREQLVQELVEEDADNAEETEAEEEEEAEEEPEPEQGNIMEEIWRSVMTPGIPNSRVQLFFNFIFLLLFMVLGWLFWLSGFNLHVLVLIGAAIGLFGTVQWWVLWARDTSICT